MWEDTVTSVVILLWAIFIVSFILLGFDPVSAGIILLTLIMIIVDLFGLIYFWDITLNAVSLVNIVMVRLPSTRETMDIGVNRNST